MSANSGDSPAVSGLDYDDTALDLTLALPGSDHASRVAAATTERALAVGWPPVRAYRRNALRDGDAGGASCRLVKVAADGAPYLRKVDLAAHGGYAALLRALHAMFAICGADGQEDAGSGIGSGRLVDAATGAEYVPTYEDRDGDWMLVGDVPWRMFVESCKRIRLMKSSEADNLAPRPSSQ
ncbi:auxin-responsive protein IAA23 [Brachypodium distachyon]|uniref:Auxin-responsive protein n=1 Tax=Brachypodium distachyon TaxID=15368 RepID=I1GXM5_BRADI|nr:auxin-responsive protein IAA23 [Brachypodium distachyon]KQK17820.1 hypothetical protein BRADI_1g36930v3 [Brachypodium distachyon]|eukprot:XP_003563684.1 auxin-responsive protein IAA23 [Brachypodium distachyon]